MPQAGETRKSTNEPFVPESDRPELKPDARVADLTVRDLLGLLQIGGTVKTLKHEHTEYKLWYSKFEHWKLEHPKIELWKVEHPEIPVEQFPVGPDPRVSEIAHGIAGLRSEVQKLSSEVAELRRAGQR